MNKKKYSDYIKFIAFILCFVGIPLGMAFTGYYYTFQSNKSILEKKLSNEINAFYTKLGYREVKRDKEFVYYLKELD